MLVVCLGEENPSALQIAQNLACAFHDFSSASRSARRKNLVPGTTGLVATGETEIRRGLATLLISTVKDGSFFAVRTEIVADRALTTLENSTLAGSAKRCVAVAVSDNVVFTFIAG